jgi:hypothetical protein
MLRGENLMNAGIDYGLGLQNIDPETGIRYGVISQNSVGQAWYDNSEADYGVPEEIECPDCDELWIAPKGTNWDDTVTCKKCGKEFDIELPCFAEPIAWSYIDERYILEDCLDTDIFVLKSPYYTFALFCSPCVPGAGNLDSASINGIKTLCLGHEWFEEGRAPYPVYKIADDSIVEPEE